jgi:eukaryotic-like serine/threonine-protein kinase
VFCPTCKQPLPLGSSQCPQDGTIVTENNTSALRQEINSLQKSFSTQKIQPPAPLVIVVAGTEVGDFIIQEKIGVGTVGEVWQGLHKTQHTYAALKILNSNLLSNKGIITRFLREALAVNEIRHPNLVEIYSVGELSDGRPYFAMELLVGEVLSKYLQQSGPLSYSRIIPLLDQICQGLGATHQQSIIHRDIKPENIFLIPVASGGFKVKVLDFGIAKLPFEHEGGQRLTRSGDILGTPIYMSPEQCEGDIVVDLRADLYSLGIILYEMLTGRTPFYEPGEKLAVVMMKQITAPPPPPSTAVTGRVITPAIDAFFGWVLSKKMQARPASCQEFYQGFLTAVGTQHNESQEEISNAVPLFGPKQSYVDQLRKFVSKPIDSLVLTDLASQPNLPALPKSTTSRVGDYYVGTPTQSPLTQHSIPTQPTRRTTKLLFWLGLSVAFIVGILVFFYQGSGEQPQITASPSVPVSLPATTRAPNSQAVKRETSPKKVNLVITTKPQKVMAYLNDTLLGVTPLEQEILFSEQLATLRLEKVGYETTIITFVPNAPYSAKPSLKRSPKKANMKPTLESTPSGNKKELIDPFNDQ